MEIYPYYLTTQRQAQMIKYKLKKDMPGCKAGTIFVHDTEDIVYGSMSYGCLKLAWTPEGSCQNTAPYTGGAFILHAFVKDDPEWFELYDPNATDQTRSVEILAKIYELLDSFFNSPSEGVSNWHQ